MITVLIIVATAVLSSILTLALAYWIYLHRLRPQIESDLTEKLDSFGAQLEERVRRGTRDGVTQAITVLPGSDVLLDTTRDVTRTGAAFVSEGLSTLLGGRRKRRNDPE